MQWMRLRSTVGRQSFESSSNVHLEWLGVPTKLACHRGVQYSSLSNELARAVRQS